MARSTIQANFAGLLLILKSLVFLSSLILKSFALALLKLININNCSEPICNFFLTLIDTVSRFLLSALRALSHRPNMDRIRGMHCYVTLSHRPNMESRDPPKNDGPSRSRGSKRHPLQISIPSRPGAAGHFTSTLTLSSIFVTTKSL